MSHLTVYKTELKNVDEKLLKESVKALAKDIGAEITDNVIDYYGNKVDGVIIGLKNSSIHRGIGFGIEKGTVVTKGDMWNCSKEYKRVQSLATNFIKAKKVAAARMSNPLLARKIRNISIKAATNDVVMQVNYC